MLFIALLVFLIFETRSNSSGAVSASSATPSPSPAISPTTTPTSAVTMTPTPVSTTVTAPTLAVTIPPAASSPTPTLTPTITPSPTPKPTATITPTTTPTPTPTPKPAKTPTPTPAPSADSTDSCSVSANGWLRVIGTQLCNEAGAPIVLRGISTAGIAWFPEQASPAFMKTLKEEWGINVFRIAMYSYEGNNSYINNPDWNTKKVCELIDAAIELDLYVIVDWHILADGNPQTYQAQAIRFFNTIAEKYAAVPNLLYEICNEPNGNVSWSSNVKPYAEAVIPVIRKHSPNSIIIVGSPTWSQDVDIAANDPLDFDNLMYSLHFYAGTHREWLRNKATTAINKGLALFATEWGTTDASGDGHVDTASADEWLAYLDAHGISWCNWSLSNKAESSALLLPSSGTSGAIPDASLSVSGKYIKKKLLSYFDSTIVDQEPVLTTTPTPRPPVAPTSVPDIVISATPAPEPTKKPASASTGKEQNSLQLLAYNEIKEAQTNTISLRIQLKNNFTNDISLDDIKLQYFYTPESNVAQTLWCDYADINGGAYRAITDCIQGTYLTELSCMEISIQAGLLQPNETATLQLRITNADWSSYDQSNDASFQPQQTTYTETDRIKLLYNQ
ncbi:MAG: cellulase family glycosylhydrolase [Lachnospiraceae bacterium]|nr:cellulase family glycosylhydrolase [Lachnospiraceae bacterium]